MTYCHGSDSVYSFASKRCVVLAPLRWLGARHAQFEIGEHLFPDGLLAECAGGAYVVVKLAIFFWRYEDK
jgi:hypothetical protein